MVPVARMQQVLPDILARLYPLAGLQNLIGVTGTNGKTSVVSLYQQIMQNAGYPAGSLGTLGGGVAGRSQQGSMTTGDLCFNRRELQAFSDAGVSHVAMEVSSHALDQGRVEGLPFTIAVFTNLSRDHLDYHASIADYAAAKQRLFELSDLQARVINIDDAVGRQWADLYAGQVTRYGESDEADIRICEVHGNAEGLRGIFETKVGSLNWQTPLVGKFNAHNLAALAGVLLAQHWTLDEIAQGFARLQPVAGRMNAFRAQDQALVVVDYAHTPDALQQALLALKEHTSGQLVVVFGCGGDRDRGKRILMGQVADRFADRIVLTSDNPRSEDPLAILADIAPGIVQKPCRQIADRAEAIAAAVAMASVDDVVLIAGKGHEDYQEVNGTRHPFDDRQIVAELLQVAA